MNQCENCGAEIVVTRQWMSIRFDNPDGKPHACAKAPATIHPRRGSYKGQLKEGRKRQRQNEHKREIAKGWRTMHKRDKINRERRAAGEPPITMKEALAAFGGKW